jgi:hypothetical protein
MNLPALSPASFQPHKTRRMTAILVACCLLCLGPAAKGADDAADLRDTYQSLIPMLEHNQFQRQLYLASQESPSTIKGEVYAVMAYPFSTVDDAFSDPSQGPLNWCDALILHPNIKYCHATSDSSGNTLIVNVSEKEVAEALGKH